MKPLHTRTNNISNTNNNNNKSASVESLDQDVCWICHAGSEPGSVLQSGFCKCAGSISQAHRTCVQEYVDTSSRDECPNCKSPFVFAYFSTVSGTKIPPLPKTFARSSAFVIHRFLVPFAIKFGVTLFELFLLWIFPCLLLGSIFITMRDHYTGNEQGRDYSSPDGRWWLKFDAFLIGLAFLVCKRRIEGGCSELENATKMDYTEEIENLKVQEEQAQAQAQQDALNAAAAVAAAAVVAGGDDENNNENNNNNNNNGEQNPAAGNEQDGNNQENENDEGEQQEEEDDDDFDGENAAAAVAAIGAALFPDQQGDEEKEKLEINDDQLEALINQHHEREAQAEKEEEEEQLVEEAMKKQKNQNKKQEGEEEEEEDEEGEMGGANHQAGNEHGQQERQQEGQQLPPRRRRRAGGGRGLFQTSFSNTLDRQLFKLDSLLRFVARYPRQDHKEAYYATLVSDFPVIFFFILGFTLIPFYFSVFIAVTTALVSWKLGAQKIENPKKRYSETLRRLGEITTSDLTRFSIVYAFDVVLLYCVMPTCIGIAARTGISCPGSLAEAHTFASACLSHALNSPLRGLSYWVSGYVVAACISYVEASVVSCLFAPGISFFVLRSININEEILGSWKLMLAQLFDASIFTGVAHCGRMIFSYTPFVFCSLYSFGFILKQSFRVGFDPVTYLTAAANLLSIDLSDLFGEEEDPSNISQSFLANSTSTSTTSNLLPSDFSLPHPSPFNDTWHFVITIALLLAIAGACYQLPHFQYRFLCRLQFTKKLASYLGLSEFLFDTKQLENVDRYLLLCKQMQAAGQEVAGVELNTTPITIEQGVLRRQGWLDASKVPSFLQIRLVIFTFLSLAKLFLFDLVPRVCVAMLCYGYFHHCLASATGSISSSNVGGPVVENNNLVDDQQQLLIEQQGEEAFSSASLWWLSFDTLIDPVLNWNLGLLNSIGFPCTTLSLCIFSGIFLLRKDLTYLLTSIGYIIVTPLALIFSVMELLKPAIISICTPSQIVESVFTRFFAIRRIVIPRQKQQQQQQEKKKKEAGEHITSAASSTSSATAAASVN